jgi:alkanesulfonate monooxygenase SsuD/methylene tetrahydromethanopterin reductase-like flavin-dependent oxidoreductase (luciferase family)
MARAAEEVGFDSVWVGDHLLYRDDGRPETGPWDAWTLLTGLAAVTERVSLGPLVACTAFRPPGVLARIAAAVDEVSGGRLVVGLGAGWNEPEFTAFGIPFDDRFRRFSEAFEIISRLLAGERVTYSGNYETVVDAVLLPPPSRRPPLMLGAIGRRTVEGAIPYVDAWNTWYEWYGNTPDGFAAANGRIDEIAQRAGREPQAILRSACVFVAVDPDAAERRAVENAPPVEGSPKTVAAFLRDLAAAGANEAILVVNPINETSIRHLGRALAVLDE